MPLYPTLVIVTMEVHCHLPFIISFSMHILYTLSLNALMFSEVLLAFPETQYFSINCHLHKYFLSLISILSDVINDHTIYLLFFIWELK
jgi:hypothetical protein